MEDKVEFFYPQIDRTDPEYLRLRAKMLEMCEQARGGLMVSLPNGFELTWPNDFLDVRQRWWQQLDRLGAAVRVHMTEVKPTKDGIAFYVEADCPNPEADWRSLLPPESPGYVRERIDAEHSLYSKRVNVRVFDRLLSLESDACVIVDG